MTDLSRLYLTRVMHRRLFPVDYRFSYRVFSLLLDLDRLESTASGLKALSIDRFNLLSFRRRDHGPRDGSSLKVWAVGMLRQHDIELAGGKILLLCFPRLLGCGFNPLSVWYCLHRDGSLRAVICEVNNTFGEHHFYLLHRRGETMDWPVRAELDKRFHVSPLIGMQARYRFRLSRPAERLVLGIEEFQEGKRMLVATQSGEMRPLTDAQLLRAFIRTPLMTFKVVFAIHWQALKILLRGAPFYRKPTPPEEQVTS
jgi:DUF1365 family protein